jgi:hypothetical protein
VNPWWAIVGTLGGVVVTAALLLANDQVRDAIEKYDRTLWDLWGGRVWPAVQESGSSGRESDRLAAIEEQVAGQRP